MTRLVARTTDEIHDRVANAAELCGTTISQFLIEAVVEKANNVVERTSSIKLSFGSVQAFFKVLDNPPSPNKKLKAAAKKYKDAGVNGSKD